jgi:hypothetical protein
MVARRVETEERKILGAEERRGGAVDAILVLRQDASPAPP